MTAGQALNQMFKGHKVVILNYELENRYALRTRAKSGHSIWYSFCGDTWRKFGTIQEFLKEHKMDKFRVSNA